MRTATGAAMPRRLSRIRARSRADQQREDERLRKARGRIAHVVVLMLENRSFDHLFAYAGIPGVLPLVESDYPNRVTGQTGPPFLPSNGGGHILPDDPPHSHISATRQMGSRKAGTFAMDGFAEAARLKIVHGDGPVIHWRRVAMAAAGIGAGVGLAASAVVRHVQQGDLTTAASWVVLAAAALGGLVWRRPLVQAFGPVKTLGAIVGGGVLTGMTAEGVLLAAIDSPLPAPWLIPVGAAAGAAVAAWFWNKERMKLAAQLASEPAAAGKAEGVMKCQPADRVRVLGALARAYATCTAWHSSVPGATWPNRNFVHAGTSEQAVDIEPGAYCAQTVFEMLEVGRAPGEAWRIYFEGMPQAVVFSELLTRDRSDQWRRLDRLYDDLAVADLPLYTFIEPRHFHGDTNSLHPGNNTGTRDNSTDFARGEELVQGIYDALVNAPNDLFERTLFVVTFDEHGGLFDRASPPSTVHPTWVPALRHPQTWSRRLVARFVEHRNAPFDFKRLGMRVPAVVVSPWIDPRTPTETYDHTSIIATVLDLFGTPQLKRRLGRRVAQARPLWDLVLDRADPRSGPNLPDVPPPDYPAEPDEDAGPGAFDKRPPPPAHPPKPGTVTIGDDLPDVLEALAPEVMRVLEERGAGEVGAREFHVTEHGVAAAPLPEQVAERLAAWRSPEPPEPMPTTR